jgi:chromosome segregation ATPase
MKTATRMIPIPIIKKILGLYKLNFSEIKMKLKAQRAVSNELTTDTQGCNTARTNFDSNAELAKRTGMITNLLQKMTIENEELDREKAYYQHQWDQSHNRIVQLKDDKIRARSSEEEQRKLLGEIKERVKHTEEEIKNLTDKTDAIKKRLTLLDYCNQKHVTIGKFAEELNIMKNKIMAQVAASALSEPGKENEM